MDRVKDGDAGVESDRWPRFGVGTACYFGVGCRQMVIRWSLQFRLALAEANATLTGHELNIPAAAALNIHQVLLTRSSGRDDEFDRSLSATV